MGRIAGRGEGPAANTGTISNIGFGELVFYGLVFITKYYYRQVGGGGSCPNPAAAFNQK